MKEDPQRLSWVTPAKYVGPAMLVILLVAGAVAGWFAIGERFSEAIITLLFAIGFLLVAIADLLGELIRLARRGARPPGA